MTSLSEQDMEAVLGRIMDGLCNDAEIAAFLTDLSKRGETVAEITGAARVLRERAATVKAPPGAIDCCGTGGDGLGTYNISTATALICAACGIPVAKHGNRAASSKSGAADVLEHLGVYLDLTPGMVEDALRRFNFAFLMAPRHHHAMKHVAAVRKQLGFRTIFNLLGPLANPAGTKRQLIGVFDKKWLRPMAETLQRLGSEKAWIVHGSDGLDEITLTGPTFMAILENGSVTEKAITPDDFGLPSCTIDDLSGGDASYNAAALKGVLQGVKSPYRNITLANAAAVLVIADKAPNLKQGVAMAASALDEGKALSVLEDYVAFTRECA